MRNQGDCTHRGQLVEVAGRQHYVGLRDDRPCPACAQEHGLTNSQAIAEGFRLVALNGQFLSMQEWAVINSGATLTCQTSAQYLEVMLKHAVTPEWGRSSSPDSAGAAR